MNIFIQRPYRKFSGVLLGLIILLIIRKNILFQDLSSNYYLTFVNQYPAWQAVAENTPSQIPPSFKLTFEQNVNNVSLAQSYGLILYEDGRKSEAVEIWQTAGLSPAEVLAIQARYALAINQPKIAVTWYEHAVNLDPTFAPGWWALGELYEQNEQINSAIAAYEQAVNLGDSNSVHPLAKLWRDKGDHQAAIEIWQAALDTFTVDPERRQWWHGLTNSLRATERWEKGETSIELALLEFPDDPQLYVEEAVIVFNLTGDIDQAEESLRKAMTLNPELANIYVTWGKIMDAEGRYEEAVSWYSKAIALNSNRSWYLNRAYSTLNSGDLEMTIALFEDMIVQFPDFSRAYYELASIYKLTNESDKAIEAIEKAIELLEKPNVNYYIRAGEIYEWGNERSKAIRAYQTILTIDKSNTQAIEGLDRLNNQ